MLDLSNLNLGQLVGRALYGELPRKPQPALVDAAEAARREAEQRRAVERERAALEEAARREQEKSLDEARAANQRAEQEAMREAATKRREARVAERQARAARALGRSRAKDAKDVRREAPPPHNAARGSRAVAIRLLLAKHPQGLRSGEVAAHLGIKVGLASAHLAGMADVAKSGVRRRFVYRLKPKHG